MNTEKILGLVPVKEDPIPETVPGNVEVKNQQLELELETIRMDIRLLWQESDTFG